MASQGQAVARQQNWWLERFVIALAIGAIMITLGWGAFTALSAPSTVAPSKTTTQLLPGPGLHEQRAGERGGAVAQPVGLPKLHPYVSIHPTVRTPSTIMTDGLVEHRRGERVMELPNGTFPPALIEHRRGHARARLSRLLPSRGTAGLWGAGRSILCSVRLAARPRRRSYLRRPAGPPPNASAPPHVVRCGLRTTGGPRRPPRRGAMPWEAEVDRQGADQRSGAFWEGAGAWIAEQQKTRRLPRDRSRGGASAPDTRCRYRRGPQPSCRCLATRRA